MRWLLGVFILCSIGLIGLTPVNAVYIQDPLLTQSSTRAGQITIGTGNYSSVGVSESNIILNDTVYLNASVNVTITGVDIAASKTRVNFSASAHSGTLNISAQMRGTSYTYTLLVDNATYTTDISDTGGWANFTYSGDGAAHYFSILEPLVLQSPANGSTTSSTTVTLQWAENPSNSPYTYQISTDNQFLYIISQGTEASISDGIVQANPISLSYNTTYYWRVKNPTGSYSNWFNFTTPAQPVVPGRLNITVFDEQNWNSRIMNFSAQIYNSTYMLNKSTISGWVNFSSAEVVSGEYLVRIVPNSSFASRSVLATSPTNATVYIPSTTNTINTVAFYLLDYTGKFPWQDSILTVSKNNSAMHSSYFDADAKVAVYLIQGDSYKVAVTHGSEMQEWGNYIPVSSGNVEVTLIDIGVNESIYVPFNYTIARGSNNITLQWADSGALNSFNFSIYKGSSKNLVHQLITSVRYGSSEYIVTNTSDIYYVYFTANTTNGIFVYSPVYDFRTGTRRADDGLGYIWNYGSFIAPEWVYSGFAILIIILMGAGFGAVHSPVGAIFTGIFTLIFASKGWLTQSTAGIGFLGGLVVYIVLYYMQDKEKKL